MDKIRNLEQLYAALRETLPTDSPDNNARLAVIEWAINTDDPQAMFIALSDHLFSHLDH